MKFRVIILVILVPVVLLGQDTVYTCTGEYNIPNSFDQAFDFDRLIITDDVLEKQTLVTFRQQDRNLIRSQNSDITITPNWDIYVSWSAGELMKLDLIQRSFTQTKPLKSAIGMFSKDRNDSLLIVSKEIIAYDTNTEELDTLYTLEKGMPFNSFFADGCYYKDRLIMSVSKRLEPGHISELRFIGDTVEFDTILTYPDSIVSINGICAVPYDCDSTTVYATAFTIDETYLYRVDIENATMHYISLVGQYGGLTNPYELRRFDCSLTLDLDVDNSSGATINDYFTPAYCPGDQVPIADVDLDLYSDIRLDSMRVSIEGGILDNGEEQLFVPTTPGFRIVQNNLESITIFPIGKKTTDQFSELLKQFRYFNTKDQPSTGTRVIKVEVFARYLQANATALLLVTETIDAGRDTSLVLCPDAEAIDLFDLISVDAANGFFIPALSNNRFDPSVDTPGTFVFIKNDLGDCGGDSALIDINIFPLTVPDLGVDISLCETDTIVLSPLNGPFSFYNWSTGSTNPSIDITDPGLYQLTVTDNNDCSAVDEIQINYSEAIIVEDRIVSEICEGQADGSYEVLSVENTMGSFSMFFAGQLITVGESLDNLSAGRYTLEIIDSLGCTFEKTIVIDASGQAIPLNLGPDREVPRGSVVQVGSVDSLDDTITASLSFEVNPSISTTINTPGAIEFIMQSDSVQVIMSSTLDCITPDTLWLRAVEAVGVFVPNVFSPNADGINDYFNVFTSDEDAQVELLRIYDRWGSLLWEGTDMDASSQSQGWDGRSQGRELMNGVYVYYMILRKGDGQTEALSGDVLLVR